MKIFSCIVTCFFCKKPNGKVAILSCNDDADTLETAWLDYVPCKDCKEKMSRGITLIDVVYHNRNNYPPWTMSDNTKVYPTGRWAVLKEETVRELYKPEMAEQLIIDRFAVVDPSFAVATSLFDSEPEGDGTKDFETT